MLDGLMKNPSVHSQFLPARSRIKGVKLAAIFKLQVEINTFSAKYRYKHGLQHFQNFRANHLTFNSDYCVSI